MGAGSVVPSDHQVARWCHRDEVLGSLKLRSRANSGNSLHLACGSFNDSPFRPIVCRWHPPEQAAICSSQYSICPLILVIKLLKSVEAAP